MIQINNNYSYFYDQRFDDLLIKSNIDEPVYSDEVFNNIYIIRSELDDSVVGIQILYYKKRSNKILKKYVPNPFYELTKELTV